MVHYYGYILLYDYTPAWYLWTSNYGIISAGTKPFYYYRHRYFIQNNRSVPNLQKSRDPAIHVAKQEQSTTHWQVYFSIDGASNGCIIDSLADSGSLRAYSADCVCVCVLHACAAPLQLAVLLETWMVCFKTSSEDELRHKHKPSAVWLYGSGIQYTEHCLVSAACGPIGWGFGSQKRKFKCQSRGAHTAPCAALTAVRRLSYRSYFKLIYVVWINWHANIMS